LPGQAFTAAKHSYAKMYPTGDKLIAVKRGWPLKDHSFTSKATFEQIYIHLLISDYLNKSLLANLNAYNMLFAHLYKMISKIKLDYIYDLFDYNRNYAQQEQIPLYRNLQYLFLAIIHRMHVLSMIRSLKGNHIAEYRDPEKILKECEPALPADLIHDLRDVLYNHNPVKFQGETTVAQRKESHAYGNHASVENNMHKVVKTMNKEERNKFVMALPCWIERFLLHVHFTPQGLVMKLDKKDRQVFDGAHHINLTSPYVNNFTNKEDECKLLYGSAFA